VLEVTAAAAQAIGDILDQSDAGNADCLRLAEREGGRLEFSVSQAQGGDQVVNDGERTVLVVEDRLSIVLGGSTLDFGMPGEGAPGPQFVLSRE
jgi:Fe-S cluster assembly iron-binding protein IscA